MVFITNDDGCYICLSHKANQDGYLRKRWGAARSTKDYEMFHRFIYRAVNGPIPDGYEIDHKCRTRGCSNPTHLQALKTADHRRKSNKERSDDIRLDARKVWEELGRPRPSTLVDRFGYIIYRWVRQWKNETH